MITIIIESTFEFRGLTGLELVFTNKQEVKIFI